MNKEAVVYSALNDGAQMPLRFVSLVPFRDRLLALTSDGQLFSVQIGDFGANPKVIKLATIGT